MAVKIRFLLLVVVALVLIAPQVGKAQTDPVFEEGLKPYGAYHGGDIDSVSLVNRVLNVHIPIVSYSQRGGKLHMGFYLRYDSPIWRKVEECNPPPCHWTWELAPPAIVVAPDFDIRVSALVQNLGWNNNVTDYTDSKTEQSWYMDSYGNYVDVGRLVSDTTWHGTYSAATADRLLGFTQTVHKTSTAGKTTCIVRRAAIWFSNWPLHSMWTPSGSLTCWATTRWASSTKPIMSRSPTFSRT